MKIDTMKKKIDSDQVDNFNITYTVCNGLLTNCAFIESTNFDFRPIDNEISLLVIHSASLPDGDFDNDNLDKLFSGAITNDELEQLDLPRDFKVSIHIYINRKGEVTQFVPFQKRAWHAGVSSHDGVEDCNNYSIGIELQGDAKTNFTNEQYTVLSDITRAILEAYPTITKERIVGHSDIAPGRKTDPGSKFDWQRYLKNL